MEYGLSKKALLTLSTFLTVGALGACSKTDTPS